MESILLNGCEVWVHVYIFEHPCKKLHIKFYKSVLTVHKKGQCCRSFHSFFIFK